MPTLAVEAGAFYYDHPVEFVQDFLGADPVPDQKEMLNALAVSQAVVARSGHGVGKTGAEAFAVLWFLTTRPQSRIPCTAPTQHQLDDVLWPEVATWLSRSPLKDMLTWTKTRLSMNGYEESWFASPRSCSNPENLQGFHGREILFVVDEASGVPQEIMEVIDGTMTNEGAKLLMAGNPTQLSGTFHAAFHKDRALYRTFTFSSETSPLVTQAYCDRQAEKYGVESDVYRVRVQGLFPKGQPDAFIRLDSVEAAIEQRPEEGGRIVIGVDPARFGDDESVICWKRGLEVMPFETFQGINTTRLTGEISSLVRRIRKEFEYEDTIEVKIDDTGVGGGVTDQLEEVCSSIGVEVMPINFGGKASDLDFADYGAQMWGEMKEAMATIRLPDDAELIAQLTTRKYKLQPDGRIKLERKEEMKKRGISSPDRADALALCLAQGHTVGVSWLG